MFILSICFLYLLWRHYKLFQSWQETQEKLEKTQQRVENYRYALKKERLNQLFNG